MGKKRVWTIRPVSRHNLANTPVVLAPRVLPRIPQPFPYTAGWATTSNCKSNTKLCPRRARNCKALTHLVPLLSFYLHFILFPLWNRLNKAAWNEGRGVELIVDWNKTEKRQKDKKCERNILVALLHTEKWSSVKTFFRFFRQKKQKRLRICHHYWSHRTCKIVWNMDFPRFFTLHSVEFPAKNILESKSFSHALLASQRWWMSCHILAAIYIVANLAHDRQCLLPTGRGITDELHPAEPIFISQWLIWITCLMPRIPAFQHANQTGLN